MNMTSLASPTGPLPTARFRELLASPWFRIAGGATAFLTASITASSDDGIVLCPFRRCTGGYCPGCGLTRSGGKLVRGDVVGSWHHHPFLLIALAQLAIVGALWASGSHLWAVIERRATQLLVLNVVVLAAIWILRLSLGDIPAPFS